jgi:hypothetical protein
MEVLVIETKSNKLITKIPINLLGLNYAPSEEEYFSEAWKCAVEDKVVEPNHRHEYTLQLVQVMESR